MIRIFLITLTIFTCLAFTACGESQKLETPLDTLKAYTQAIKKQDTATMKSLLSKGSLKMAADEAKSQNAATDEVIKRETLFSQEQRALEYRNEKIDGDSATIEVKNTFGTFERIPFIKENGTWKIAKEKYAEEMMKQSDEEMKKLDEQINQGKQPE
jgi:Domain of unknown function (DUF4878)/Protein of unknown function (DUF2950)